MDRTELDKDTAKKRRKTDLVRLESWKAIANYLSRSVRTVRRWEATENLPVHRHRHRKGFSVYAYQAELDAWNSRHKEPLPAHSIEAADHNEKTNGSRWGSVAAALVLGLVVGGVVDRYLAPATSEQTDRALLPLTQIGETADWPKSVAEVLVAPVFSSWTAGRIEEAFDASQSVAQQLPDFPIEIQGYVTDYLVEFSLSLGRISDARELVTALPDGETKHALDAYILFAAGEKARIREVLEADSSIDEASIAEKDVFLAIAAMMDSNIAEAKSRLQAATDKLVVEDQKYYFVALDMLSGVLVSEGNLPGAISILEKTMSTPDAAAHNRSSLVWLMCQRNLANLYREAGRESDAVSIENALRGWLVLADETFPLALSLVNG